MAESAAESGLPIEPEVTREPHIKGKELEGDRKIGINSADIPIYKEYFEKQGGNYEIYKYINNPEIALLVPLDGREMQKKTFSDLVAGENKKTSGAFWSDSTVGENTDLQRVAASKSMSEEEVGGGVFNSSDNIRLTLGKIRELRKNGFMSGFPQIEGSVSSVSGDTMSVQFGDSVRLIKNTDVVRAPSKEPVTG